MKKIIIGLLCFTSAILFFGIAQHQENTYKRNATIIDHKENITVFKDAQGYIWESCNIIGKENEQVTLIMDDQGTTGYIFDDIIVKVIYNN